MRIIKPLFALGLSLSLILTTNFYGHAQTAANYEDFKVPNFIPKVQDANVANLIGFTDFPVSLNSGTPNISIPITNIGTKDVSVNVSLNYVNGNGIGARQEAGAYGLGWDLSAGGVLTQQVVGSNDFGLRGYKLNKIDEIQNSNLFNPKPTTAPQDSYLKDVTGTNGTTPWDLQPDRFTFSAPGISGGFYLDYFNSTSPEKPILTPASDLKVVHTGTSEWIVTDTKGTQYIFGGSENGQDYFILSNNTTTFTNPYTTDLTQINYYLRKIISINGEAISYSYEMDYNDDQTADHLYFYTRDYLKSETRSIFNSGVTNVPNYSGQSKVFGKLISEITFPNGKLKFKVAETTRYDLKNNSGVKPHAIEYIELYDSYDNKVKTWKFNYSYFGSTSNNLTCRLKLNSLIIKGEDSSTQGDYIFSYDNTSLPSKSSYGIDHWGYPNGANNSTLVPSQTIILNSGAQKIIDGAHRESTWNGGRAGILTGITYPTGGTTNFAYESNTVHEPYYEPIAETFIKNSSYTTSSSTFTYSLSVDYDQLIRYTNLITAINGGAPTPSGFVTITPSGGGSSTTLSITSTETFLNLTVGNYTITVDVDVNTKNTLTIKKINHGTYYENKPVGGVRIKTITHQNDIDPTKNIVKNYTYNSFSQVSHSSGVLILPHIRNYAFSSTQASCSPSSAGNVVTLSASAMGGASPSVSYSNVKESIGSNHGYSRFTYTTTPDGGGISQGPTISNSHQRGLLLKKQVFNSGNQKLIETVNTYSIQTPNKTLFGKMIRITKNTTSCLVPGGGTPQYITNYGSASMMNANLVSNWTQLIQSITTNFDPNGIQHVTTNKYTYNSFTNNDVPIHYQKITSRTQLSDQNFAWETAFTNAFNFKSSLPSSPASNSDAKALSEIIEANIHAPIEVIKKRIINPGASETSEVLETYYTQYRDLRPTQISTFKSETPISGFTPCYLSSGNFTIDNHYSLDMKFEKYAANGSLLEYLQADNTNNAIIWGYHQQYPIAMASNTNWNEIAYTSFETNTTSNWDHTSQTGDLYSWNKRSSQITTQAPFTGNSCAMLTSTNGPEKSIVGIDQTKRYKVSAWVKTNHTSSNAQLKAFTFLKNGGGANSPYYFNPTYSSGTANIETVSIGNTNNKWVYIELEIDIPTSVPAGDEWGINIYFQNNTSQALWIDEVRILPVNAQMQTYTYDYPNGKTSDCDVRNNRTSYEYDPHGRLKLIRDHNEHIVKSAEYHYK
jgi:YD repeat-containing protein